MTALLLKVLHVIAMLLWLGAGLGYPVIRDLQRTLALDCTHGQKLIARLRTTTRIVVPAAVVTVASGFGLIFARGGFAQVPVRIHVGLALALAVFGVGAAYTSRAMKALEISFRQEDQSGARQAADRVIRGLWIEDALRFTVLLLMLVPVEVWLR